MANEELVIKLKKGVDDWNAWRRSNRLAPRVDLSVPDPDLSGADLSGWRWRKACKTRCGRWAGCRNTSVSAAFRNLDRRAQLDCRAIRIEAAKNVVMMDLALHYAEITNGMYIQEAHRSHCA